MSTTQLETENTINLPANADLSASQNCFGIITAGKVAVAGAGANADGVITNAPAAADRATKLQVGGVALVRAGAAVTASALVMSNASGKAITATATNRVLGKAIDAATSADDLIRVLLINHHISA